MLMNNEILIKSDYGPPGHTKENNSNNNKCLLKRYRSQFRLKCINCIKLYLSKNALYKNSFIHSFIHSFMHLTVNPFPLIKYYKCLLL